MGARLASLIAGVLTLAACAEEAEVADAARPPTVVTQAAPDDLLARGRALVHEYECVRCHAVPGIEAAPADKDCVGCHQRIEAGEFEAEPAVLARWRANIEHLTLTPDLAGAVRLRRAWIEQFLQAPHDVRPGLDTSMPRLDIDAEQAAALAAFLSPQAEHAVEIEGDPGRGRELVAAGACGSCHRLDAFDPAIEGPALQAGDAARLAPDLSQTRHRVRPDVLLAWLQDPRSIHAATAMPATGLSEAQARDVAAFLLRAPLPASAPTPVSPRLPVLERAVSFAEVEARVFKRTCWHCHSDPAFAPGGDGGPGNSGGLGFSGRGLDLSSLSAMSTGSRDDEGRRRSIFRRLEDGTPALVAHLDARRVEEAGGVVEGVRGMPLGLPALAPEDIQLVESWIAQGRPQ